jgi:hypothetical protein
MLPVVKFDHGITETIARFRFELKFGDWSCVIDQIPLILAWALTIHKVQSATLSLVVTDLTNCFCPGQTYVCLSRVRDLESLYLVGIDYNKIKAHKDALNYYRTMGYECKLQYLDECQIDPWVCTIGRNQAHPDCCGSCLILYLHIVLGGMKMPILVSEMVVDMLED